MSSEDWQAWGKIKSDRGRNNSDHRSAQSGGFVQAEGMPLDGWRFVNFYSGATNQENEALPMMYLSKNILESNPQGIILQHIHVGNSIFHITNPGILEALHVRRQLRCFFLLF
jgi:hypothetical protein